MRVLEKIATLAKQPDKTNHERYLEIYRALHAVNADMAGAFDGFGRSRVFLQMRLITHWKLLTPAELGQFSPDFQERLQHSLQL